MRDFDDNFIDHYIQQAGPEVQSSVETYRVEEIGVQLFQRTRETILPSWSTTLPLLAFLRQRGVLPL